MESTLLHHKFRTLEEKKSSVRTISPEKAVEIYLTMNGSRDFLGSVTVADMEGLVPANGATYGQWLAWNHGTLIVQEAV